MTLENGCGSNNQTNRLFPDCIFNINKQHNSNGRYSVFDYYKFTPTINNQHLEFIFMSFIFFRKTVIKNLQFSIKNTIYGRFTVNQK